MSNMIQRTPAESSDIQRTIQRRSDDSFAAGDSLVLSQDQDPAGSLLQRVEQILIQRSVRPVFAYGNTGVGLYNEVHVLPPSNKICVNN